MRERTGVGKGCSEDENTRSSLNESSVGGSCEVMDDLVGVWNHDFGYEDDLMKGRREGEDVGGNLAQQAIRFEIVAEIS